jgi:hypothetical protein
MQPGQPSRTALSAARLRAAHQVLDNASILADPLALRILGDDIQVSLDHAQAHLSGPRLRWFIAARSRIAEEVLDEAVNVGATQLVVAPGSIRWLTGRRWQAGYGFSRWIFPRRRRASAKCWPPPGSRCRTR